MPNHPEPTPFSSASRRGIVVVSHPKGNLSPVRGGIVSLPHRPTTKCQTEAGVKAGKTKFQAIPTANHTTAGSNVPPSRPFHRGWLPGLLAWPGFGCRPVRVKPRKTKMEPSCLEPLRRQRRGADQPPDVSGIANPLRVPTPEEPSPVTFPPTLQSRFVAARPNR